MDNAGAETAYRRTLDDILDAELLLSAIDIVKVSLEPNTWEAFRRAGLECEDPRQVADSLGMTTAAVFQAKYRVKKRLASEIQRMVIAREILKA